jgi:hypothetical protein
MNRFHQIIAQEEKRCTDIVDQIKDTLAAEAQARLKMSLEIERLKQERLEAEGWREKREIEESIMQVRQQNAGRMQQDSKVLNQPYFGVLEIEDDDLGGRQLLPGPTILFRPAAPGAGHRLAGGPHLPPLLRIRSRRIIRRRNPGPGAHRVDN